MKKLFFNLGLAVVLTLSALTTEVLAATHITLIPGNTVEVGEEIVFDASYYIPTYSSPFNRYEWAFGDGYFQKKGPNPNAEFNGGAAVSHCFMAPGTYNVKLDIYENDDSTAILLTDTITITVTGEAPMAGFELWHADFHARIAQYIYGVPPEGYSPDKITISIKRESDNWTQNLSGEIVDGKLKVLLNTGALQAGEYVVIAKLHNSSNAVVSTIRELLHKPYNGLPKVGIDELNNIRVNNELYFPVTPYMLDNSKKSLWEAMHVLNATQTIGTYDAPNGITPTHWNDYMDDSASRGWMNIGPAKWQGQADGRHKRNSNIQALGDFIDGSKNHQALLAWTWEDEPDMGDEHFTPAATLRAWTRMGQERDPQHPSYVTYYGLYGHLPRHKNTYWHILHNQMYSYSMDNLLYEGRNYSQGDKEQFGGKRMFPVQIIGFDIYPIANLTRPTMLNPDWGHMEQYVEAFDRLNRWNYHLVPAFNFVETNRVNREDYISPLELTAEDFRMEIWLSIIHGAKGIEFFQYFHSTCPEVFGVASELAELAEFYKNIILSEDTNRTVTDNANIRGNRVDTMIKETATDIYIFAARVTEPDYSQTADGKPLEQESISVNFNISGIMTNTAYEETVIKKRISGTIIPSSQGKEFDITVPNINQITKGTLLVGGYYKFGLIDRWVFLLDKGDGTMAGFTEYGGNKSAYSGTVNYETGAVHLNFQNSEHNLNRIQWSYKPKNFNAETISLTNGNFTDTFNRSDVKIYRIPKTIGPNDPTNLQILKN